MPQITISQILPRFTECRFYGDENTVLNGFKPLGDLTRSEPTTISWVKDSNVEKVDRNINLGLLILSEKSFNQLNGARINFLISPHPRYTFLKLLSLHFSVAHEVKTEATAVVHETAKIGAGCYIGHHVVIEEGVSIGNDCVIDHNTVIKQLTQIGNRVQVGCNCTIGDSGFGYEKDEKGIYQHIPHIGNVVIKDDVRIHDNTCIDRAMIGSTVIHEEVKIDNLVHIAHGVVIEKNSLVIANTVLAGSVHVGENVWVAPSTTVRNRIHLAHDTFTGIGSVIVKNTKPNSLMVGNPAIDFEDFKKWLKLRSQQLSEFNEEELRDK